MRGGRAAPGGGTGEEQGRNRGGGIDGCASPWTTSDDGLRGEGGEKPPVTAAVTQHKSGNKWIECKNNDFCFFY